MSATVDVVAVLAALSGALAPVNTVGLGLLFWWVFKIERRLFAHLLREENHGTEQGGKARRAA